MAKGLLRHFFSFSIPTASLEFLLCLTKLFFCNNSILVVILASQTMPPTFYLLLRVLQQLPIPLPDAWSPINFSLQFLIFLNLFTLLWSQGEAISTIIALLFAFSTTTMSGHTVWSYPTRSYIFRFPLPLLVDVHTISYFCLCQTQNSFQWSNLAILCLLLLLANILHSLIMLFIVSPFWLHSLRSGDSTTNLSILNLKYFVFSACSWAAKISASVSIYKSLFLIHSKALSLSTASGISCRNWPYIFFLSIYLRWYSVYPFKFILFLCSISVETLLSFLLLPSISHLNA